MRNIIVSLFILAFINTSAQSVWKLDASHSSINFAVSHLVISETTGSFDEFEITANTGDDFRNPKFEVTIQTASINTKNKRRDDHLRADDFFAAEKFPTIVFQSTAFQKTEGKKFELKGTITIKGTTKEVTFNGKLNGVAKTAYGTKAGLKLTTTINRNDFTIGSPGGSVGDEVDVTINVEMNKQ